MSRYQAEHLNEQLRDASPTEVLASVLKQFGDRIALASSLSAEDQVITDLLAKCTPSPHIFTLDTGRLPPETYDVIQATNDKYGITIKILFPDREEVESMVAQRGPNLFHRSVELRKLCCRVRKVIPLQRELATLDAWITGLRREQSITRTELHVAEWDESNSLIKINPLADWTDDQVWDYIRTHDVPYNVLHDQGYPSLGCAPCTRAVRHIEDIRAGRWWWEDPEHKECGLHLRTAAAPDKT